MKRRSILLLAVILVGSLAGFAQQRKVQHKPYIDLRPLHFGIVVGTHLQDIEFENVGPQTIVDEEGNVSEHLIVADADKWNPGFSVGVLAELRLHENFALRFSPSMYFGAKHLTFLDLKDLDENGRPHKVMQDLKNTYVGLPVDIKFSAPRFNNYRPFISAGVSGIINLTGGGEDYVSLKRFTTMVQVGLGCDFYLPFFKLIPELKFCYGLGNSLDTNHINELRDANRRAYAGSVSNAQSKMILLSFYFE
ncbi:MAG: PorT family protein [Prevotella sp.]|nr:PorT family protein [Prevotella sp.]